MPIVYNQLVPANNAQPGYAEAKELARQTLAFYGQVAGLGVGIGGGSCRAAVALAPAPVAFPAALAITGFALPAPGALPQPTLGGALPYSICFGNSQLAMGGLAPGPIGGHAERAALTAAAGQALYTIPGGANAVMFVELTPCGPCQAWLNGGGGGVANPFNGVINGFGGTTLNVWWRWVYPGPGLPVGMGGAALVGGVNEMELWHTMQWVMPGQLADVNNAGSW
ncbi:MAG TPA: hypothetical protein VF668_09760 [Pyrinomonadaceae bacterium]|jgi:hypothetical protein